ncbi:helix-turn-helix domain-containing protein [Cohnella sp. GCM10027633]|uniref:helix-turn-helix domain-containing protein n=1 Tax=unclassified Cohnella TaxID=2636738 RepID=UPI00362F6CB0
MDDSRQRLIRLYLANLRVNTTVVGFNPVMPHWRELDYRPEYNKFYLIVDGEGWLKIGDRELYPKPGQLALMPEGVTQSYSTVGDRYYTKYWCHFTAKVGSLNLFDLIQPPWLVDTSGDDEPARLFREMLDHSVSDRLSSGLLLQAALLRLISYYVERANGAGLRIARSEAGEQLRSVLAYIDEHVRESITIASMADLIHVHPNYFIRLFKKHLGVSPIQYVNRKRIEEAKWLLASSDLPLYEIGPRIGIPDVSYLSKLFKAATGFSPSAYRSMLAVER